jgi:hypothetical protein
VKSRPWRIFLHLSPITKRRLSSKNGSPLIDHKSHQQLDYNTIYPPSQAFMLSKERIEFLIQEFKKEELLFPLEDDFDNHYKKQYQQINTYLNTILNFTPIEPTNTLGFFVRNFLYSQREHRINILTNLQISSGTQPLKTTMAPTCILINEFKALAKICNPTPIKNWPKYSNLILNSHEERSGRKGKKYLLLYTPTEVIYLFSSRFGPWLTTDAEMNAKH